MKSLKRLQHRPARRLRDAVREVPGRRPVAGRPGLRRPRASRSWRSSQPKIVVVMGEDALAALNDLDVPLARPLGAELGRRPAAHAGRRRARRAEHRRGARRGGRQARVLVGLPGAGRVVRGPAALLAGLSAPLLAYVLVAPELPQLHPPELSALVACTVGADLRGGHRGGAGRDGRRRRRRSCPRCSARRLLVAALDANDVGAAATPFEAVLLCCLGDRLRGRLRRARARPSPLPLFLARHRHRPGTVRRARRALFTLSTVASPATRSRSSCPTGAPGSRRPA